MFYCRLRKKWIEVDYCMFKFEISPEEEAEVIERNAQTVVNRGLETPALMLLKTMSPMAYFGTQMARIILAPLFIFLGSLGDDLLLVYEKGYNVKKLADRIEELHEEKERRKDEEKRRLKELTQETDDDRDKKKKSWLRRIFGRS